MPIRMMTCIPTKEYAKAHGLVERTLGEYFYKKKLTICLSRIIFVLLLPSETSS